MPSDDENRRELFDLLEAGLGSRGAALLMSQLPPAGWAELATKRDLADLRAELRGEMAGLRGEMAELRGEMAELRGEVATEIGALRIELHDRMSGLVPRLWAANVATMIGLSGLVFAVASFAN